MRERRFREEAGKREQDASNHVWFKTWRAKFKLFLEKYIDKTLNVVKTQDPEKHEAAFAYSTNVYLEDMDPSLNYWEFVTVIKRSFISSFSDHLLWA